MSRRQPQLGYLELWRYQDGKKQWCKRYFQLKGTRLMYGEAPNHLNRYCIVRGVSNRDANKLQFRVQSSYPDKRTLHLRAKDVGSLNQWYSYFERVLEKEHLADDLITGLQVQESQQPVLSEDKAKGYVKTLAVLKASKLTRHLRTLVEAGIGDDKLPSADEEQLKAAGVPPVSAATIVDVIQNQPDVFNKSTATAATVTAVFFGEMMSTYQSAQVRRPTEDMPTLPATASRDLGSEAMQRYLKRLGNPVIGEADVLATQDELFTLTYGPDSRSECRALAANCKAFIETWRRFIGNPAVVENFLRLLSVACLNQDRNKLPVIEAGAITVAVASLSEFPDDYDVQLWGTGLLCVLSAMRAAQEHLGTNGAAAVMKAAKKAFPDDDYIPYNASTFLDTIENPAGWR